jgi:chain length determinant protein EpsF
MTFYQFLVILLARRRAIILTLLVTVGTTALISFVMPKTYTASTAVLVDSKGADPITGMMLPAQLLPGYMATQVDIITSHNVAVKVVDAFKLAEMPEAIEEFNEATQGEGSIRDWLADALVKDLDVKPSRESSVINISYSGRDPQFASELANAFAKSYIQTNLELKVEPARLQTAWFEEQIKNLRSAVEEAQKHLSDYQRETGIIAPDERLDVESARLAELSSQLVTAQAQTFDSESRQRQIADAAKKGRLEDLPDIQSNSLIQNLKAELARAEAKLAETAERSSPNHPQYQGLQAEVDSLKRKIGAEIQSAKGSISAVAAQAQRRESEIEKSLAEQKAKVLQLKQQRDTAVLLTREVESAQRAYDSARQRAEQIRLESQRNQTEIAVLNPAVPPLLPSKPKKLLNIAISIFLGSLLGIGLALLLELIDRRVRSSEDVSEGLGIPVLATFSNPQQQASGGVLGTERKAA